MLPFAAADFLRYLALAVMWTLVGRVILFAAGQGRLGLTGWLLAPSVAQAAVAVALGIGAVGRVAVHNLAGPLWVALIVLAIIGAVASAWLRQPSTRLSSSDLAVFAAAVLAPALVILPCFVHGFAVSQATVHPDAWSYSIFGAYLWDYPRFTEGGLAPAYQWASNLNLTRFVAPSQLGLLSAGTHEGDTAAAYGLVVGLASFTIAGASAAVGRVLGLQSRMISLVALAAGGGNWIGNAVLVSNLDNLLALSYLPALAALGLDETPASRPGRAAVCGLMAAATVYTYPEFAAACLGCSALYFARPLWVLPRAESIRFVAVASVVATLLVLPYLGEFLAFFTRQLTSGVSTSPRPGEGVFAGLLHLRHRPAAAWGLGPEDPTAASGPLLAVLAVLLLLLAAYGLWRLSVTTLAPTVNVLLLLAGFSIFIWRYAYSYGAYKFILLGWWVLVVALAFGVRDLARRHRSLGLLAVVLTLAACMGSLARSAQATRTATPGIAAFRALSSVERLANGAPIALAVADDTAAHWATYFLRHTTTRLVWTSGYLAAAPFKRVLDRATNVPLEELRLVLTDASDAGPVIEQQPWRALWRNERYTLFDTGDVGWAFVARLDNGYPYAVGANLVWIGDKPLTVVATSNTGGLATVKARVALSQGGGTDLAPIRLRASDGVGGSCEWGASGEALSLMVGLHAGENVVTIEKTSPVGVAVAPMADQRHPFMVGLVQPTLEFARGSEDVSRFCSVP